jgi:hypothetical protein
MHSRGYAAALVSVSCVAALSNEARADSPSTCFEHPTVVPNVDVSAPSNSRIWFFGDPSDLCDEPFVRELSVGGPQGTPVATTQSTVTVGTVRTHVVLIATPVEPLKVGARYNVECGNARTQFDVSSGPDLEAPPLPALEETHSSGDVVIMKLDPPADLVVVDVNGAADIDMVALEGSVSSLYSGLSIHIGHRRCDPNHDFDDGSAEVRLGTMDLAGNFSGFSAPFEVEEPGCSIAPPGGDGGRSAPWGVLGLLGLAVVRWRAGRPSARLVTRR